MLFRSLQLLDLQLEGGDDTGVQAHGGVIAAELLDGGRQLDLLFVDFGAGQGGQQLGDLLAGDLAVQLAGCTALDLGGHDLALDLGSQLLCGGACFGLVVV